MLSHYMEAGLDPDRFWSLTPRLYLIHMEAARKRMEREARDLAWAVWHIAALGRVKRMPRLDQFIPAERAVAPRPLSWQAQFAAWQAYAAARRDGGLKSRRHG